MGTVLSGFRRLVFLQEAWTDSFLKPRLPPSKPSHLLLCSWHLPDLSPLCLPREQGGPVEILPFLFLGSAHHAARRDTLDALGITALLNVSSDCPNHFEGHFQYKCIPVEDNHKTDISSWFMEAIEYIGTQGRSRRAPVPGSKLGGHILEPVATMCCFWLGWATWTPLAARGSQRAK